MVGELYARQPIVVQIALLSSRRISSREFSSLLRPHSGPVAKGSGEAVPRLSATQACPPTECALGLSSPDPRKLSPNSFGSFRLESRSNGVAKSTSTICVDYNLSEIFVRIVVLAVEFFVDASPRCALLSRGALLSS